MIGSSCSNNIVVAAPFLGRGPLATFFRQLSEGLISFSFGPLLFLAPNTPHAKDTLWGGKFCSPTPSNDHDLQSQPILLWGDPEESLLLGDPNLLEGTSSIAEPSGPAAPAQMKNFILSSTETMSKIHAYWLQVIRVSSPPCPQPHSLGI